MLLLNSLQTMIHTRF